MLPVAVEPLTIRRAGSTTDAYGNTSEDWDTPTDTDVTGHVQPDTSAESLELRTRDQVTATYRIWFEPTVDVMSSDRIVWGTRVLTVVGEPQLWPGPFGGTDHIEVLTTVSEG